MNEPTRLNIPEWTVSELSAALKKTVEDAFGYVRVRGEISGYRGPQPSGHCYFALKDEGAKIEAVIFKSAFARMRLKPEEGLEVFVTGRLTTYPGRSKYQIVIETLEPAGLGALMALKKIDDSVATQIGRQTGSDLVFYALIPNQPPAISFASPRLGSRVALGPTIENSMMGRGAAPAPSSAIFCIASPTVSRAT